MGPLQKNGLQVLMKDIRINDKIVGVKFILFLRYRTFYIMYYFDGRLIIICRVVICTFVL